MPSIQDLRQQYQREICQRTIYVAPGNIPSLADASSRLSIDLSTRLLELLGHPTSDFAVDGQTAVENFERISRSFLEQALGLLYQWDPCRWRLYVHDNIADFDQYKHLAVLAELARTHKELKTTLREYLIQPDIIVARLPLSNDEINGSKPLISQPKTASLPSLRAANVTAPNLYASISCKWKVRSDRSQNSCIEWLNLICNRKGHTPRISVVTGEPMPSRIALLAMGTGDIDCVYHFALHELVEAVRESNNEAALETLEMLIDGRRLRDIADLPFDLAI